MPRYLHSQLVYQEPPADFSPKMEVAACFIKVGKNFLFLKRQSHKSEGNLWGIPGGKCERGETTLDTVLREIKEETALDISNRSLKYFGKVYIRYPEIDFIYHTFECPLQNYPTDLVIEQVEHTEHRWVTLEQALELPLVRGEAECIYLLYDNDLKVRRTAKTPRE